MNSFPREWGCYDGFPGISDGRKLLPSKAGKHRGRWSYRTRGWAQQTQEPGRAARRAPLPRCLPSGARARGAEGPRSRPGTSGELSPQSCSLYAWPTVAGSPLQGHVNVRMSWWCLDMWQQTDSSWKAAGHELVWHPWCQVPVLLYPLQEGHRHERSTYLPTQLTPGCASGWGVRRRVN